MNQQQLSEMFTLIEKAKTMERIGNENKALEIYLELLDNYTPNTSLCYERPAIILEKKKRYEEALKICERAVELINDNKLGGTVDKFQKRIDKIHEKLAEEKPAEPTHAKHSVPKVHFNFKNLFIIIGLTLSISLILYIFMPKKSPYEDVYIDMSDFDRVTELDGSMFIDEEGNKLPEITIDMIDYARTVCNVNPEVDNSIIIVQNGTLGFGVLLKEEVSKERAQAISEEFVKAFSKAASNYHKDLASPSSSTFGGIFESYDMIISLGRNSDTVDYKASMNKGADLLVWRK